MAEDYSHKTMILATIARISNISTSAVAKITQDLLEDGLREVRNLLSEDDYSSYASYVDENSSSFAANFDRSQMSFDLTTKQSWIMTIERAESFMVLYHAALSLRSIKDGPVITDSETFGDGRIDPSSMDELLKMRDQYRSEAIRIISMLTNEDGEEEVSTSSSSLSVI